MPVSQRDLSVGDARELLLVDDLTRTQIVMYAGASGDYNPLHTDERFTREVAGYPGVFAHGMLTMGMTGRILTDWFGAGQLTKYGVRFSKQVWPGEGVHEHHGAWFADLSVVTKNQHDEVVVSGTATAQLDP